MASDLDPRPVRDELRDAVIAARARGDRAAEHDLIERLAAFEDRAGL